jgi:serine/threonine-protein kinase PknK
MLEFKDFNQSRYNMTEDMLEKLLDISRKMAENRLLDPLLEYAMGVALELFNAEQGYLMLLGEDNSLDFRVRQDRSGKELSKPEEQISHTIFKQVINDGKPLVLANAGIDPNFQSAESVHSLKLQSVLCVPLISRGKTLGAIYIENRSKASIFTEEDLRPLEHFAAQAAVSIENAILNNELESRVEQRTAELAQINQRLREEIEERKRSQGFTTVDIFSTWLSKNLIAPTATNIRFRSYWSMSITSRKLMILTDM